MFHAILCCHSVIKELVYAFNCAYTELWMHLGNLESTQEARVSLGYTSSNSYLSLVFSKLPACIHNSIYMQLKAWTNSFITEWQQSIAWNILSVCGQKRGKERYNDILCYILLFHVYLLFSFHLTDHFNNPMWKYRWFTWYEHFLQFVSYILIRVFESLLVDPKWNQTLRVELGATSWS